MSILGEPGATIENFIEKEGWKACVQEKGWFDTRVGQIWIEKVLAQHVHDAENAFLLVDHFSVHLKSDFVKTVNNLGVDVDFIPAGYTCVLQPVDVGVNAPFKAALSDFHHTWCLEKYPQTLNTDKLPTPERKDVYEWVLRSYEQISVHSIQKTFMHVGFLSKDTVIDTDDDETLK